MAVIDLGDLSPAYWFDYDDEGAAVKVRPPTPDVLSRINRECVKTKTEYKRLKGNQWQRFEYKVADQEAIQDKVHAWVVADWKGFFDKDGNEIPYSEETAIKMMRFNPEFYAFVDQCIDYLEAQARKRGPEKN